MGPRSFLVGKSSVCNNQPKTQQTVNGTLGSFEMSQIAASQFELLNQSDLSMVITYLEDMTPTCFFQNC